MSCLDHAQINAYKRISLSYSWGIFLFFQSHKMGMKIFFALRLLLQKFCSLITLGFRVIRLICLFFFANKLLGKKSFSIPLLISSRLFYVTNQQVEMINLYSCFDSPHVKFLRKSISPIVDYVTVLTTALLKQVRSCGMDSEDPKPKVPILNSQVSDTVLFVLSLILILMILLSCIFSSFLISGLSRGFIFGKSYVNGNKEVFMLGVYVVIYSFFVK